jgi:hypothetical protein
MRSVKCEFHPALINTERAESANLTITTTGAPMNLATKSFRPRRCAESPVNTSPVQHPAMQFVVQHRAGRRLPQSIGDVMMENLDPVRLVRVVAGAAVLVGVAASIVSCSGNGSNAPSTTQSPTTTTTTTQSPTPGAPPPAPTEKSISPTGGNLFTPTVRAPMAPTAIPGNRENTG